MSIKILLLVYGTFIILFIIRSSKTLLSYERIITISVNLIHFVLWRIVNEKILIYNLETIVEFY